MKEICKNCKHASPTYKGILCKKGAKTKKVKVQGTCEDWREKE